MRILKSGKFRILNYILNKEWYINFIPSRKIIAKRKVYCIGLPRSGTHTIAGIFSPNFSAKHEPLAYCDLRFILNKIDNDKNKNIYLRNRNRYLNYEIESSHYLVFFIKDLIKLNPGSKYILTVREPLGWIKSYLKMLDNVIAAQSIWLRYEEFKLGLVFTNDSDNIKNDLIKALLDYYKFHVNTVIESIDRKDLLVLDTYKINKKVSDLAQFLEIDEVLLRKDVIISNSPYKKNYEFTEHQKALIEDFKQNFYNKLFTKND